MAGRSSGLYVVAGNDSLDCVNRAAFHPSNSRIAMIVPMTVIKVVNQKRHESCLSFIKGNALNNIKGEIL